MNNLDLLKLEFKNANGETQNGCCIVCKNPFTSKNVFTPAGWIEIKITQMCEKCFDECTIYDEEDDGDL